MCSLFHLSYKAVPLSPGIICGLAPDEREFAQAFISMGFKEEDVIRTMQKYGKDHKEVNINEMLYVLFSFLIYSFHKKFQAVLNWVR